MDDEPESYSILEDLMTSDEDWDTVTIDELERRYREREISQMSEMQFYGMCERDFWG